MNEAGKLSLDMFLTLLRYMVIAYCMKIGVTSEAVMEAYIGLIGAFATILWGFQASGYFNRAFDWFKKVFSKEP